tara:strand:- start:750 stop:2510 length:1761 start_codon:yes stop_codon:yes gene_type:complete
MNTKDETTGHKEKGSWWGLWAKITFFLAVLLVVIFAILSSLGGNSDTLREAIEQFLSQRFGGTAEVGTLHQMTFYPYMGADFESVNIYRGDDKSNSILNADRVSVAMGFWDVSLNTGKIKTLNVENLRAVPGSLFRKGVTINRLAVVDEGDAAFMRSNGKIGAAPYSFEATLEKFGQGKKRKYAFGDVRPFQASIGQARIKGQIEDLDTDMMQIKNIELGLDHPFLTGNLKLYYGGAGRITMKGDLHFGEATALQPDLLIELERDVPKISGDLVFTTLDYDDALDYGLLVDLIDVIKEALYDPEEEPQQPGYDWSKLEIEADITVEELAENGVGFLAFKAPLTLQEGALAFGPLKSLSDQAVMDGRVTFDTSAEPAKMAARINLQEWDYAALQKAFRDVSDVKGKANLIVDITSQGNGNADLKNNLGGHVSLIAGRANFPVKTLNLWGSGLVNMMLPDLSADTQADMNCAVADFEFENGVASANALFIDTSVVTVRGKGTYDYPSNMLDLSLEPESKGVEVLDVAVPVHLRGALSSPDISASKIGIAEKLGSLSLGLMNPAFLVYSLTDLGLAEDHPCRQFIERPD